MPDLDALWCAVRATWPSVKTFALENATLRDGGGGGGRVSAATVDGDLADDTRIKAEDAMRALGQKPQFAVPDDQTALAAQLDAAGYRVEDETNIYLGAIDAVTQQRPPPVSTFVSWPPLAVQREIWAIGGIGPARVAVMERATCPKTSILGRADDQPAGTVYVAVHADIAMVHGLEILAHHRRKGLARHMMAAAGFWARDNGALWMSLQTTKGNLAANPLYASLGMDVVGSYHYRRLPE